MGDKVVANLGGDHDLVAIFWERLRDVFLAQAVAVSIRRIEQGNPQIERLVHEGEGLAFGVIAPPPGRDRPQTSKPTSLTVRSVFLYVRKRMVR